MTTAKTLSVILFMLTIFTSYAQSFRYGIHLGYAQVKYSFPVERDTYHPADIEPINTLKAGASVQYVITKSLRVGTGLGYMSIKGKKDGGDLGQRLANPNSEGRLTFDVQNTFLILPVDFQLHFGAEKAIRPILGGGLNFFKPLNQNVKIHITPAAYDASYEEVSTTIDNNTPSSYFGARLGGGVAFARANGQEMYLIISRDFNLSRYNGSDAFIGIFDKHEIRFNMWEITVAWSISPGSAKD